MHSPAATRPHPSSSFDSRQHSSTTQCRSTPRVIGSVFNDRIFEEVSAFFAKVAHADSAQSFAAPRHFVIQELHIREIYRKAYTHTQKLKLMELAQMPVQGVVGRHYKEPEEVRYD